VEYYFKGPEKRLTYPWSKGLTVDSILAYYDSTGHKDFVHAISGAPVLKAQHPEFEMYNQGIHARSGVACADCHMPYVREGAMKVSDHWVRSPLLMVNRACQTCHHFPESELTARVAAIQDRTHGLIARAAAAVTDMLDAIRAAQAAGIGSDKQQQLFKLQRQAQWRLDFVSSENSTGFHASQETARVLGESIDYARQAQALAVGMRAPAAPASTRPAEPVQGVTPAEQAPPAPYRSLTQ
jgi:nitrite reductase (cytochrome c-552)